MSRLADALLRAAGQGATPTPPPCNQEDETTPFSSPWDFDAPAREHISSRIADRQPASVPAVRVVPTPVHTAQVGSAPTVRLDSQLASRWPQPFAADVTGKLVLTPQISAAAVEQYRHAAARLEQAQRESGVKTVVVTSAAAGEGRTLTAANLALTLSESFRRRVLLIDAHLQRPRLHHVFQVSAGGGLVSCLRTESDQPTPAIELTSNLSLLPAGRGAGGAGATLTSDRMRELLATWALAFDWVILDTAPVCDDPETAALSRRLDRTVLVVRAGRTGTEALERAVDLLGRATLLGVVLNRAGDSVSEPVPSLPKAAVVRSLALD